MNSYQHPIANGFNEKIYCGFNRYDEPAPMDIQTIGDLFQDDGLVKVEPSFSVFDFGKITVSLDSGKYSPNEVKSYLVKKILSSNGVEGSYIEPKREELNFSSLKLFDLESDEKELEKYFSNNKNLLLMLPDLHKILNDVFSSLTTFSPALSLRSIPEDGSQCLYLAICNAELTEDEFELFLNQLNKFSQLVDSNASLKRSLLDIKIVDS